MPIRKPANPPRRAAAGWVLGADSQHFVEHITALSVEGGKEHSDRGMSVSEASAYRNGLTGFGITRRIKSWLPVAMPACLQTLDPEPEEAVADDEALAFSVDHVALKQTRCRPVRARSRQIILLQKRPRKRLRREHFGSQAPQELLLIRGQALPQHHVRVTRRSSKARAACRISSVTASPSGVISQTACARCCV